MALVTIQEIRDILEGYCVNASIVSDAWISDRLNKYVIPTIIEKRLGISISGNRTKTVYLNGTGTSILFLPEKNIQQILSISYTNAELLYTISIANLILISEEGILKARSNLAEGVRMSLFPRGIKNLKVIYEVGYESADIPDDINELIAYLTILEILTWIEGRSGGGDVSIQNYSKSFGEKGKYTNIRNSIISNCNTIIRNYTTKVV